jgi:hypothetical protein
MNVQGIAMNVGVGNNLVVAAMNVTHHDDRRSSPPQSKLHFFDVNYNGLG